MHLSITTARKLIALGLLNDRTPELVPEHADTLAAGELVLAAVNHIMPSATEATCGWPFTIHTLPPGHSGEFAGLPIDNLVKASMLLEAEIDRRLRAGRAAQGTQPTPLAGYCIEAHGHDGRPVALLHKTHGREMNLHGDLTTLLDELADLVTRSVNFTDPDVLAEAAYSNYCREANRVSPTGESLPTWEVLSTDPAKSDQVEAWRHAAVAAVLAEVRTHPIDCPSLEPPVTSWRDDPDERQHELMHPPHARKPSPAPVGG